MPPTLGKVEEAYCVRLVRASVLVFFFKKVGEYDQEITQSQTADNPMAPRGGATQPSRDSRKTNLALQPPLSSPSR